MAVDYEAVDQTVNSYVADVKRAMRMAIFRGGVHVVDKF
jgi:hypothetical protein